ncbi:hypothetical protein ACFY7C_19575 [Streptomyces sp. NPDC012769]|uniref:hypothetical protein n=1 Tax=Streptomyces sp. NPDC012769 TaxID=3364848 RepID=UPI0036B0D705
MAWSASAMFREFPVAMLNDSATGYTGLDSNGIKAALYDNDITPDKDAAVGSTGYNTGQWAISGNEVTDSDGSSDWAAGGIALGSKTITTPSSGVVMFDAADTTHSNTVTITNAFGCLVYNDDITAGTVADQGVSYHYFGGAQSVTTGTFTIVWHANGIFRITV